ncbi:Dps family protein [Lacticaseibacillus mingshuiensis]|uniref:DNA starvation/stationary phase protection protein n=1 Tax=Lacticaseibacillus mingshuiensis TaxID=2799574 RepID=A0ABW4CL83_9LACO|nr:DNA starvation/stationary phase protection protein [Lacticaseibacillus mingshuiensis]
MSYSQTKLVLNQLVADLSALAVHVHQVHWYMRGPNFLKLHPLMDKYMDELNDQLDVVSERLITLDGSPYASLKEFADHTTMADEPGEWGVATPERLRGLATAYSRLADTYQRGIDVSGDEHDDVSQDIFIGFKGDIEKKIWMLKAELNEAPGIDPS